MMFVYLLWFSFLQPPLYNHPVSRVLDYRENELKTHHLTTTNTSNNTLPAEPVKITQSNTFKFSQMSMDDFRLLSVLGRGHFGKVHCNVYYKI